jgi:hypothetical protein
METKTKSKTILTDNNFSKWEYELVMYLTMKNLLKAIRYESLEAYITAKELNYDAKELQTQKVKWMEADDAARGYIGLSVDAKYHATVKSCATSYELYNEIRALFDGHAVAQKFKLKSIEDIIYTIVIYQIPNINT